MTLQQAIGLACGMLTAAAACAADSYTLDPGHTFPRWQLSHFGFSTHHGQFNKTRGKLVLDPEGKAGSLQVTVDAASVGTGDPKLEERLRSADFFNVQKFPELTFKSTGMTYEAGLPATVTGEFTMLGVTRPLTLRVSQARCAMHPLAKKPACGAEVSGVVKRSEYGMVFGIPGISDEIRLTIQVEAIKE